MMKFLPSFFVIINILVSFSLGDEMIQAARFIPRDNRSSSSSSSSSSTDRNNDDEMERNLLIFSTFSARVDALVLVNATSDIPLTTLTEGQTIFTTDPTSFSVLATVTDRVTRSVVFEWTIIDDDGDETTTHIENTPPYTLCSNANSDIYPCQNLGFGEHTLSARACSKRNGLGKCTTPFTVNFRMELSPARVVALVLVDATLDVPLTTLTEGLVINATTEKPSLSVVATVEGKPTRSVVLEWTIDGDTSKSTITIENTAPYALCKNKQKDYYPCPNLTFGQHKLRVKACSKRNGQGKCTAPIEVTFRIQRPMVAPPPTTTTTTKAPIAPVTNQPVQAPLSKPTKAPSSKPSKFPSSKPSTAPSNKPSKFPSSKPSKAPSSKPSNTPSSAPSIDCTANVINFINCNTLTGRTLSLTGTTAEDEALQWVATADPMQLSPDTDANRLSLLQRYALMTLWVQQTVEASWITTTGWATNQSECTWFGVVENTGCDDTGAVKRFSLNENNVIGTLSPDLGLMTTITVLNVMRNGLTGFIPPELVTLTAIDGFRVRENKIVGSIPSVIGGAWKAIRTIQIERNQITGSIPSELGALTKISYFGAGRNQLRGSIPSELGAWTDMFAFFVENNLLTGTFLAPAGKWTKVSSIGLYCNDLDAQDFSPICATSTARFGLVLSADPEFTCPCCYGPGNDCV